MMTGDYDMERDKYYESRRILEQKSRVTYKSCNTLTSEAYIWTYRTTSCDVLSIITTTVPLKDGLMKDIKIQNKEGITIRQKSHLKALKDSPFQIKGLHVDLKEEKKKLNKILYAERKIFMTKLNISRYYRSKVENDSATRVQSVYRGYYTRRNLSRVMDSVQINKQIRGNIKSYLANRYGMVVSLTSFKADRMDIRNTAASLIQDKFICYLSRACLRLKRYERWFKARSQAVVTIQARARGNSARFRVAMLIEKVRGVVTSKAVLKIQTCFRAMCGRRTVRRRKFVIRWIAADIIINWYRARHSRKIAHQISLAMYAGRANRGALRMQIIIRRFLAKCRVDRIRMRRLYATLFVAATTINCLVRRFLAKITVSNKRDMLFANKLEQEESARQAHLSEVETKIEEEQKALLESVDIFLQASLGNTAETEDIFKGLVDTEPHTPSDVNVTGDTILTIAAAEGNIELVRKCLLWGFDVNHRNDNGDTALTLVAKKNHFMLMQYLLSLPATLAKEMPDYTPLDAISEEDMGVLLVAAAVNSNESGMEMLMALLDLGLDVNSVDPISGMTAMHAVCEVGLEEAFQLLHSKYKADMKVRDNLGQTPLHKAAGSSYGVTQQILGLDPNYSSYMTDTERTEGLVERDANEKDCLLLAAIGGQIDTVDLLEQLIESFPPVDPKPKEPITWITSDMAKVANLVELGNVLCLQNVIAGGFNTSTTDEETGNTLPIIACISINTDVIDQLIEEGADFSLSNKEGNTAMHFAAMDSSGGVISHLLMHKHGTKCGITQQSLLATNAQGDTPLHCAARQGLELKIDLIARDALEQCMNMQNKDGMTPFLVACSMNHLELANSFLKRGADTKVVDIASRNCMWHLLHSDPSLIHMNASKRPICSEYTMLTTKYTAHDKYSLKDSIRIQSEVAIIHELMGKKFHMRLYTEEGITAKMDKLVEVTAAANTATQVAVDQAAAVLATKAGSSTRPPIKQVTKDAPMCSMEEIQLLEPGDVLVREWSVVAMKRMLEHMTQLDCWQMVMSTIAMDTEGSLKLFLTLLANGAIDVLSNGTTNTFSGDAGEDATSTVLRPSLVGADSLSIGMIRALEGLYFLGTNIMGWMIRFNHIKGIELLLKKGYDCSFPIDRDGNAYLHLVALHGTVKMLNFAFDLRKIKPQIEQFNKDHQTPSAIAVACGNFTVFRRLYDLKASPRLALRTRYAAWALAFARRREVTEIMTQWGRIGNDDELLCGKVGKKFPEGDLYSEFHYI